MEAGNARRSFFLRGGLARVMVVSAGVFALLGASTSIVGPADTVEVEQEATRQRPEEGGEFPNEEEMDDSDFFLEDTDDTRDLHYPAKAVVNVPMQHEDDELQDLPVLLDNPPTRTLKWPRWRKPGAPKVKAISAEAFKRTFPPGIQAVECGMYPISADYTIRGMEVPNGDWIMNNFEVARKTFRSVPRNSRLFKLLPPKKVPVCSSQAELLKGFQTAAQWAPGLENEAAKAGFDATLRAVLRYKTTNLIKRPWLCVRRPNPRGRKCDWNSSAFKFLLDPLRGVMCWTDLFNICAVWGNKVELEKI